MAANYDVWLDQEADKYWGEILVDEEDDVTEKQRIKRNRAAREDYESTRYQEAAYDY